MLALEATGHYWRNLFVALLAKGYAVAVLNPFLGGKPRDPQRIDRVGLGPLQFLLGKAPYVARYVLLGSNGTLMLGSQQISRSFRAAFCILSAACMLFGPAVAPGFVLCVESAGFVHVEPVNASCFGRHFESQEGSVLVHDCGDCNDTALSASLHRPVSD